MNKLNNELKSLWLEKSSLNIPKTCQIKVKNKRIRMVTNKHSELKDE